MAARYKLVLVGDSGVGKTSLFHRVLLGYFKDAVEDNRSTLGFDCFEKSFNVQGELIEVELHDSPGKTRFETQQISSLYRSSNIFLLIYSVHDVSTFVNLRLWYQECREYIWGDNGQCPVWAVVGNKSDLPIDVSPEMVDDLISELDINLTFEVSAKTGEAVEEMFDIVIEATHHVNMRRRSKVDSNVIRLDSENSCDSSRSCNC